MPCALCGRAAGGITSPTHRIPSEHPSASSVSTIAGTTRPSRESQPYSRAFFENRIHSHDPETGGVQNGETSGSIQGEKGEKNRRNGVVLGSKRGRFFTDSKIVRHCSINTYIPNAPQNH